MYTLVPYRSNGKMAHKNGWMSDSLFDRFFDMGDWFGSSAFRVDVKDMGDRFELQAELPGVKRENIDLSIKDDTLTIGAEFKHENNDENPNYVYSERRSGKFMRSFDVSSVDQQNITADYTDGVLSVILPKLKPQEPVDDTRRIAIGGKDAQVHKE